MSVPAFKEFLLPTLSLHKDGQIHSVGEIEDKLAQQFNLTELDRLEVLESGNQTRLRNRVTWAHVYLAKAKLLERVARSRYQITDRGRKLLAENLAEITPAFLKEKYAEFRGFVTPKLTNTDSTSVTESASAVAEEGAGTPEERLETSFKVLRGTLAQQLLDQVKASTPAFFERLVVELLVAMGYGGSRADAGKAVGRSGDGGIDGIIKEDRLGLDAVFIQAKRWDGVVGREVVQAFVGALAGRKANKGVLITTSTFSKTAKDYADSIPQKVILIDGSQLVDYMIEFGIGVTTAATYEVKRIDSDFFEES